jgi:type IV fimbrial biogenesis protein FimT
MGRVPFPARSANRTFMKTGENGLTLIELMVTLAVAIVLLAIGIPAFQGMEANNRAVALAQGLVSALTLARTEAVGRGVPVAVCGKKSPGPGNLECLDSISDADKPCPIDDATASNNPWCNGWLVFVDTISSGSDLGTRQTSEELIRAFPRPRGGPTIKASAVFVRFASQGFLNDGSVNPPAALNFQLAQTGSSASQTRCVTVASLGQPRTERVACP